MEQKEYRVEVQADFLQKLGHVAPVTGLAELIWNSLDADATNVEVVVDAAVFGNERVIVRDDGSGFPHDDAPQLFGNLGNSWKRMRRTSKGEGRFLHGAEGQGRFKSLAIGRVVTWKVIRARNGGGFEEFDVWIAADQPSVVHVTDVTVHDSAKPGTTVTISELAKGFTALSGSTTAQALCEMFSSYLQSYPSVHIKLPSGVINPAAVISASKRILLPDIKYNEKTYPAELDVVAWKMPTERFLYLCDERGLSQGRTHLRVHAPGFNVSAHLKSSLVPQLAQEGGLGLEELEPALRDTFDRIGEEVKAFHRERLAADAQSVVNEWKEEAIYPYTGEPVTPLERIEREVFDVVASRLNRHMPDFTTSNKKSKQFQLRLLRNAIERSPEDLRTILNQVLDLPQTQRRQLAEMLEDISLTGVISAARLVADRLEFLAALEHLLFNPTEKNIAKERRQLHRLLVPHTWIFGERFALSVDDKSLNEVLRKHLQDMNRCDVDLAAPVLRPDGKRGIVDLMLSQRVPRGKEEEREHLIVELKRPKVVVGSKELDQVKRYALAVANDERFRAVDATWEFWLLTNEYDPLVALETGQANRPAGLVVESEKPKLRLWVKTWAQVLEENRARMRFVEQALGYEPDHESALAQLKARYAQLFAPEPAVCEASTAEATAT